ncbi:hypothetical protein BGZ90_010931 [Linnemannia elongata]|nr:hypothetical protein BGZ90_010931 [Linnemannia elongata]
MKLPSAERVNVRRLLLEGLADRRANNVPDTVLVKIHGTVPASLPNIMWGQGSAYKHVRGVMGQGL